ncbi:MAG: hypothetical protein MZV70_73290 [Desulfobacterales bacterium]|nr:hypothetical protein [Desulfobacterales bacterium]
MEACLAKGYNFPKVTSWIRAHKDDLKLVRECGLDETGILTSVSDYHIYPQARVVPHARLWTTTSASSRRP